MTDTDAVKGDSIIQSSKLANNETSTQTSVTEYMSEVETAAKSMKSTQETQKTHKRKHKKAGNSEQLETPVSLVQENTSKQSTAPLDDLEPPFKKNRRIQVPSGDITKGISSIEPSPKKPHKKKFTDPTPQKIGVLFGIPCRRRPSKNASDENRQLEMLKHLGIVFLFSRLKNPIKWNADTFEEIRRIENSTDSDKVTSRFPIEHAGKMYCMALTNTIIKGRMNSPDAPPNYFEKALIEHVSDYSGLVQKYEDQYVITWRITEGYYLYDPCLKETSQLLFFNSLRMMIRFIQESKQLTDKSKFYMSHISWISVYEGSIVTLNRKTPVSEGFIVLNRHEALLIGDRYLKEASFKFESLRISLNAISLAQQLETRSWEASNLNELFEGVMTDKVINKLGLFLCEEGEEEHFLLEKFRLIRLVVKFDFTEREHFESVTNCLLAIRVALIMKIDESYFAVWSSENILYWFSPFRYDALELNPAGREDKACFLYAFNSLSRLSHVFFEYLTEVALLPKHPIQMFTVDTEPFGRMTRLPFVDSTDSLNHSELEISVAEFVQKPILISDGNLPPATASELKLCRIILREIMTKAETNYPSEQN
ncbi:uncharacterized protein LOC129768013 [Toxorhynchites rutilus septentrionalis]|uniref:uncharacterized protein LOC129768013 n=1 Tax=Toxorhynchites rutilus septentrionalis TaxID=329112 RepID=UPI002479A5B5|nr:uncharacterized protein LOC129768013 [Toxorhynchites rutilus septentrionalis]